MCDQAREPAADGEASPRVTVAISTWNRAHLVGRALASARAQTVRDIEILVIDDGSTDETPTVLAGVEDRRVRVVRLERNGGISRARNTAIRLARGEWVAFHDDDNEWAPQYLVRQLECASRHPGAGVIYCRAWRQGGTRAHDVITPEVMREGWVFAHLARGWMPLISGTLIHRSLLLAVGGLDEALRATEDRDLWLRLAERTEFVGSPETLVVRHIHEGAHLSRNYAFVMGDARTLDTKWKATMLAAGGWMAYRRWRTLLFGTAELVRALDAAEARNLGNGLRSIARLSRHLPWSAPFLARALVLTVCGSVAYQWLAERRSRPRSDMWPVAPRRASHLRSRRPERARPAPDCRQ
jgi:glycosyltransferase involved in cell wall biosynthesis